jgi:NADPH:quinone reductase-like Zn-dependent oxidoreductase
MQEGGTDRSRKLMENVWRDGAFADYAKVPLENCIALDEAKLCQELGYSVPDLVYTETIIVCPATGGYGGAGIQVAIALGARVVAMGRNEKELARLKEHVMTAHQMQASTLLKSLEIYV